jgi:non-specific serine/threonine protein kinase/serine/threonine-protein kinase
MAAWDPQVNDVFLTALEIESPQQRQEYLDRVCGGNVALRSAVERLLRAAERADQAEFLASPSGAGLPPTAEQTSTHVGSSEVLGSVISNYKLLERIGEGGFGVVYLAEQFAPVRRQVAIKIIKPGMDSAPVIKRFEAERQALAMMDHPNIAKVLDAGTTEAGRPYFVMELVQGVPITRYCDAEQLTPQQRLELFIPVCQAVQHAHQKGLIHRDLKPSNVLIGVYDGRPVPKVIDFGVAKAIAPDLTQRTMFTEVGSIVGTLEYMAPEQAELNNLDIDTRADIYSLGVILYELLAGSPPFTSEQLRGAAFDQMLKMIREVEPAKPSTKLSTAAELPSIAARRKLEPARLRRLVHGELDWIVMKALEKDRVRRYETANGLAMDLQRYLADEPVTAAAPSAAYRVRKFVRRNKGPVLAASIVVIVLVAGIIGTTAGLVGQARQRRIAEQQRAEADRQRIEAQRQEEQAKQQAAIAAAVSGFQSDMLLSADPDKLLGDKVTVLQAVTAAIKELDAGKLNDQPLVEAGVRQIIGATLRALGRYDDADESFKKSLDLRRAALGANDPMIVTNILDLATTARLRAKYEVAEQLNRQALDMIRSSPAPNQSKLAMGLNNLAAALQGQGKVAEAEAQYREVLALNRQRLAPGDPLIAKTLINIASVLREQGKYDQAATLFREALEILRKALPAKHPDVAAAVRFLAQSLVDASKFDEAESLFREALESFRSTLPENHPRTADVLHDLADVVRKKGKLAEAELMLRESLEMRRKSMPASHPAIASDLNDLGRLLREQGQLAEAESLLRDALEIYRKALPPGHRSTATALNTLGRVLKDQGKYDQSERMLREALAMRRQALPPNHPDISVSLGSLGDLLHAEKKLDEAEPLFREALDICRKARHDNHPEIASALVSLGRLLKDQGKAAAAEAAFREALEIYRKSLPAKHAYIAITLRELGLLLDERERDVEAEPLLREAVDGYEQAYGKTSQQTANARSALGVNLLKLKRYAEAEAQLLEAERVLGSAKRVPPGRYEASVRALIQLYSAWDQAEASTGHAAQAEQWKAKLPATQPTTDAVKAPEL